MAARQTQRPGDGFYTALFVALLCLFAFRVGAQLWQTLLPTTALPPFDAWQSGLLPYPALLVSQAAIIAGCIWFAYGMARGSLPSNVKLGWALLAVGAVYFAGAAFRLIAGLTFLRENPFFAASIPSFFHVILASMVLIAARYHLQTPQGRAHSKIMSAVRAAARVLVYPALMLGALGLTSVLLAMGASIAWAPYLVVALVGPLVLLAERLIPYRADWLPSLRDFLDDGLFLAIVQVALPLALGYAATLILRDWLAAGGLTLGLWPVAWPIWAQLILKIVSGDFLRYWLHRFAHTWTPLWRLHEVHHHPDKLYTTNVFRFHPAEKGLQFFCDTLPFLFLGVGREVLGYYFVFYAISGLLQHANCDVRLGFLNYIVSGPEVHRWHHSKKVAESNNNYAHSFVVWDLVFGTYFRPKQKQVETLGLLEADYPQGFFRQMTAPFRRRRMLDDAS